MTATATLTYSKFANRYGTQPPTVPDAPASASTALKAAVTAYEAARVDWLAAETDHAQLHSDQALRDALTADLEAERQRAARGDYSDPGETAEGRLGAERRAAVRRVTAAQDRLAETLYGLEAACGGADLAAPVDSAARSKASELAGQLAELADQLDAPRSAERFAEAVLAARRGRLAYVPEPEQAPGPVASVLSALTDALR